VRGNGGAPVVGLTIGDGPRFLPGMVVGQGRHHDIEVVAAPALPGQPDGTARISSRHDVKVRAGHARQADGVGPLSSWALPRWGVTAVKDFPVAVHLLAPGDYDVAL